MITLRLILFFLFTFFYLSFPLKSQFDDDDLSYLQLLPDNQAQSIAERLGIQTGKPIDDTINMETIDQPKFDSIKEKNLSDSSFLDALNTNDLKNVETFGLNLFKDSPTTFAPIDLVPAPLEYVIGPGDELRIQLFGNEKINRNIPVSREGVITIPEVGVIEVIRTNF